MNKPDSSATTDKQLLDLVFTMDCTGSMGSYIQAAKKNIEAIVEKLVQSEGYDLRFALIAYRDHPPQDQTYVTKSFPFTNDLAQMKASLSTLSAQGAPEWLSWSVIYYTKLVWSLSAVPFLIFNVPVVGESMHQSKMTAYDQMGRLVPALSGAMMKRRIEMEEEEARAAELESLDDDEAAEVNGAALKIQKIRRGSQQRKQVGARLMRHVVSITTPLGFFVSADEIEKWFTFGK